MIDIKVSLTVAVPGAVPFSKQSCFKNDTPIEGMTEKFHAYVTEKNPQNGKPVSKRITLDICKRKPARQVINMSSDAYNYMTGGNSCPEWFRTPGKNPSKEWKALNDTQRLEMHLERVAADLGGVIEAYSVADD